MSGACLLYTSHPLAVAQIVAEELHLDSESIEAALLHDVIEDTPATYEDVAKLTSPTVADLVEGVSKLTRIQYATKEDEQMENLRKMLIAMSKDIRVILIKISDRLHNMRTMEYQSPAKQKQKSLETMEIYAPIAHRLGMQRMKWELEDLSLKYLDPIGYDEIVSKLDAKRPEYEAFMSRTQAQIDQRLKDMKIDHIVYGRMKHPYSIYRKMFSQNKSIDEIFDLFEMCIRDRRMTSTPIKSLLLGAGITIAIQSSSAMTVMLVGLVNSGVMELGQTIGVIMGSNIGTTLTAWLLSLTGIESESFFVNFLKPKNFSPLLALAGILLIMGSKKQRRRDVGRVMMGFSILMYGMELMSGAVAPLADMPEFTDLMTAFTNPLLGVLVGAAFTGIIQSSAASVGILQALAMTGSVTYGMAIPIIMGQNIGTCVTALILSLIHISS